MPFLLQKIKVGQMEYRKAERMAGLSPIPWFLVPFLYVGFLIWHRRLDAYEKWKQERAYLALHRFPPSQQWFSPILSFWIGLKFWMQTKRTQQWFRLVFAELCNEEGFSDFRLVKNVGWVKIEPGFVHVRIKETIQCVEGWRTEFTINESWPGQIYVHTRSTADGEWKTSYRIGWELRDTAFIIHLEELWRQIERSKLLRNVVSIREAEDVSKGK